MKNDPVEQWLHTECEVFDHDLSESAYRRRVKALVAAIRELRNAKTEKPVDTTHLLMTLKENYRK